MRSAAFCDQSFERRWVRSHAAACQDVWDALTTRATHASSASFSATSTDSVKLGFAWSQSLNVDSATPARLQAELRVPPNFSTSQMSCCFFGVKLDMQPIGLVFRRMLLRGKRSPAPLVQQPAVVIFKDGVLTHILRL